MNARAFLMAIALLPLQAANAAILLNQFGAFTTSAWGDCLNLCTDALLDVSLTTLPGPMTGGAGVLTTSQTLTDTDTVGAGTLVANATILGGLSTPLLGASATSNAGRFATTQAIGAQGYDVIGGGAGQIINFAVTLTGNITNAAGNTTGLTATVGTVVVTDLGDFILEQTLLLALFDPNAVNLEQTTNGAVNLGGNASVNVNEGDQFYLWALVGAAAGNLGTASSLSTLSVAFTSGAENLQAAGVVPLPASVLLLTSALAVLGVRIRRV